MQFRLTYHEVEELFSRKMGKSLPLAYNDNRTIRISYPVPLMGSVDLDITIERINGTDIYVSYGGGAAIEFMVRTALNQAKNQPGMDIVETLGGNNLLLALGKSQQMAPLFERITLEHIRFDEQFITIQFMPKDA